MQISTLIASMKKEINHSSGHRRLNRKKMGSDYEYEGKVHGFAVKSEQALFGPSNNPTQIVWTFTLLRFNDELGSPLPRIPIEMRGKRFDGFINDEDTVVVKGKWKEGEVLKVNELYNKSNNIRVKTHRWF